MTAEKPVIHQGRLVALTQGCYSDYGVSGFFVALATFEPMAELEAFLVQHPEQREPYCFQVDHFTSHLLSRGLLLEIQWGELHMGDYSNAGEVSYRGISE